MNKLVFCLLIEFLLTSCSNKEKKDNLNLKTSNESKVTHYSLKKEVLNDTVDSNLSTTIADVHFKMKNKLSLNITEYKLFAEYLIANQDIDDLPTEGFGYVVYNYFKNNKLANTKFGFFLKNHQDRVKIINSFVELICIEILYPKYSIENLIKEFSFIENKKEELTKFNFCISQD
jgi:hypothetical protein